MLFQASKPGGKFDGLKFEIGEAPASIVLSQIQRTWMPVAAGSNSALSGTGITLSSKPS